MIEEDSEVLDLPDEKHISDFDDDNSKLNAS